MLLLLLLLALLLILLMIMVLLLLLLPAAVAGFAAASCKRNRERAFEKGAGGMCLRKGVVSMLSRKRGLVIFRDGKKLAVCDCLLSSSLHPRSKGPTSYDGCTRCPMGAQCTLSMLHLCFEWLSLFSVRWRELGAGFRWLAAYY